MNVAFPQAVRDGRWGLLLIGAMLSLRLAHVHLLWADEDYHLAAAIQILHGKVPYRDFWYDKPPLSAFYYLLVAGHAGWLLRLLDAGYVAVACFLTFQMAKCWWTRTEGWVAAALLAFFTTFYLPSAVIPFAADALMLVPHLAAVYSAQRKRPLWAGIWAGVAFLANPKALFVLATCAVWMPADLLLLAGGFLIPGLSGFLAAVWSGAWSGYVEQVWRWGLIYTTNSPESHPLLNGTVRTFDWLGFHAALACGTIFGWLRLTQRERWRMTIWLVLSFAAVSLGSRFASHYFLQLLPVLVLLGARGIVTAWQDRRVLATVVVSLLLFVPLVRFGPRYVSLAYDTSTDRQPNWADVAMDLDSQAVARKITAIARPGDTLFVWGYRPDIYVYARMVSPGLFWDSQPLTGVPADRHLSANGSIFDAPAAAANRSQLIRSKPTWIVDGLGLLNPRLSPEIYPEVRAWLNRYELAGRTKLSLIYRLR